MFEDYKKDRNLIITWPVGVGKTYAVDSYLRSIEWNELNRYKVTDWRFKEYLGSWLLKHRDKATQWQTPITNFPLELMIRTKLLFFDDIWVANITEAYLSKLTYVLDERIAKKLPTIFTTNLNSDQLKQKLDKRIYSRMLNVNWKVIVVDWEDKRTKEVEVVKYKL